MVIALLKIILGVVITTTVTQGCSEPEGGYTDPTEAEKFYWSDHVVVGTVLRTITPDPVFGDMYGPVTYGAQVQVRCMFKGGPLKSEITIHGAGFVPGLCTAKPLVVGREYFLFLEDGDWQSYSQGYPAENYTEAQEKYRQVCDVIVTYPEENGVSMEQNSCPAPATLLPCHRYNVKKGETFTEMPEVPTTTSEITSSVGYTVPVTVTTEAPRTEFSRDSSPATSVSLAVFICSALVKVII